MLQQTTVAAVTPRYQSFLKLWPSVESLAAASFEDVAREWAGLGYYARARNLHACAKKIAGDHGGVFPQTEDGLRALPGVGAYTAAAVAAIAFGAPANVVDGNVERVMARLFAIPAPLRDVKADLKRLAGLLVADDRPGDYAQALMDLGAAICTPRNPNCLICPVSKFCEAFAQGLAHAIPAKAEKAKRLVRFGAAFALADGGRLMLERRPDKGLLGGMLGLPGTEWRAQCFSVAEIQAAAASLGEWGKTEWILAGEVRHVFTHFELRLTVWRASGRMPKTAPSADLDDLAKSGLPTVFRKAAALAR